MSFRLWRIRKAYRLRIWWRLTLPQWICEKLGRHVWEKTVDWTGYGRICKRCLKAVRDGSWQKKRALVDHQGPESS